MKISVISFTRAGAVRNLELAEILQKSHHQAVSYSWHKYTGRRLVPFQSLQLLFQDIWGEQDALLFVCDLERTVRSALPWLLQRGQGPAVVVADEKGSYVIPLLSGKMRGLDAWCTWFAKLADAAAVVTSCADRQEPFSLHRFAQKNCLHIQDSFRIQTVMDGLAAGETVGIYSDYPVEGVFPEGVVGVGAMMDNGARQAGDVPRLGISLTDDWEAPHFEKECRMFPCNLAVGIACQAGTAMPVLERFVTEILAQNHLSRTRLCGLFSVRELAEEPAILELADKLGIVFLTYEKGQAAGENASREEVCDGCARLGSGNGKRLVQCREREGMLACVYGKETEISF